MTNVHLIHLFYFILIHKQRIRLIFTLCLQNEYSMIERRNFKGPLLSELCHASQNLTVIKQNKILHITEIISVE